MLLSRSVDVPRLFAPAVSCCRNRTGSSWEEGGDEHRKGASVTGAGGDAQAKAMMGRAKLNVLVELVLDLVLEEYFAHLEERGRCQQRVTPGLMLRSDTSDLREKRRQTGKNGCQRAPLVPFETVARVGSPSPEVRLSYPAFAHSVERLGPLGRVPCTSLSPPPPRF